MIDNLVDLKILKFKFVDFLIHGLIQLDLMALLIKNYKRFDTIELGKRTKTTGENRSGHIELVYILVVVMFSFISLKITVDITIKTYKQP